MTTISVRLLFSTAILVGLFSTGCCRLNMGGCDLVDGFRHEHLAKRGWRARKSCYADLQQCLPDFRRGFRDGYVAALEGQADCPPILPPECYWGIRYQAPAKRCCVQAWHDGWSHGAVAAEQDGLANLHQLVLRCSCGACPVGGFCPSCHHEGEIGIPIEIPAAPTMAHPVPMHDVELAPVPEPAIQSLDL